MDTRDVETGQRGKPYAAGAGLNSPLSTGHVDNKLCAVGDTLTACVDPGYRSGDRYLVPMANWLLTRANASI